MGPEKLQQEHRKYRRMALDLFDNHHKMGGEGISAEYRKQLEAEIEDIYVNLEKHNENKDIFAGARTPGVLIIIMVACYILAGFFGLLGLEALAFLVNLVLGITLVTLCVWLYVRYSGDYRELNVEIDKVANILLYSVSKFCIKHFVLNLLKWGQLNLTFNVILDLD